MDLISPHEIVDSYPISRLFGGEALARLIFRALQLNVVNNIYNDLYGLEPQEFITKVIEQIGFRYELDENELKNIPAAGGFITVSNHAYGGLDGILLLHLLPALRPDFKVIVNFILVRLEPIRNYFLGVNPFETYKDIRSSIGGLRDAFQHINQGHPIGIFPAGEVSAYKLKTGSITDKEWQHSILRFIKKAEVPVVPIYFDGHNSTFFSLLGMVHPTLRTVRLPSELLNKKGKTVRIRIGAPIPVKEQDQFKDISEYGHFLRMRTYNLGIPFQKKKRSFSISLHTPEPLIAPVPSDIIKKEIEEIRNEFLLCRIKDDMVFCVPTPRIPNIMKELGRLREITYREVGEGTRKGFDIDEYDPFFEQLFIWDDSEKRIVGGYRIGKADKILEQPGNKGLYIQSLFKIDEKFIPVLKVSIELGRSFVVKDYQRKALSLFLLWKGILYLLLKHPEYRYLIGPVSISNEFKDLSRMLAVEFLKNNYFNSEFAEFIRPRKEFKYHIDRTINKEIFHKYTEKDIGRLDHFIQDFDPLYKTPILLKKYISVNAEILGFNIDPKFNNCLDALMILDLFEVPLNTIETLSKEFNDQSVLERFKR